MDKETRQGIALLITGVAVVSLQDVLVKLLSDRFPIHEILVIRYTIAILLFGWLVAIVGDMSKLRTQNLKLQLMRGTLAFCAGIAYYMALAVVPLADTTALFFTAPLFVSIFGWLFFGEQVGWPRWVAVGVGFLGMLIMMRPGGDTFEPVALMAVLSAVFYAFSILLIRKAGAGESAVALSLYSILCNLFGNGVMAIGFALGWFSFITVSPNTEFLTRDWVMPTVPELGIILCVAAITVVAFYTITQAYRLASPSLLSVFEYTALFWGVTWGALVWKDYPDMISVVGIVLMVGAGLFTIFREMGREIRPRKWFTGRAISRYR